VGKVLGRGGMLVSAKVGRVPLAAAEDVVGGVVGGWGSAKGLNYSAATQLNRGIKNRST